MEVTVTGVVERLRSMRTRPTSVKLWRDEEAKWNKEWKSICGHEDVT